MITRFAPSPTGPLHLGHAFSALLAHDRARACGGQFLLRIEDIDQTRCRPQWEAQLLDDLQWLGVTWDAPPMRQSDRLDAYRAALDTLWQRGLLYPCHCRRRDIQAAASAPQEGAAPVFGPDGLIYPGTCRNRPRDGELPLQGVALRLDMARALTQVTALRGFHDHDRGLVQPTPDQMRQQVGDIVLSRRDFLGSYHLSVVLDDAAQGVTEVIRGQDLFDATAIHVLLQQLLDLPTPHYHHHRLIRDQAGKRLAKRDDARAIATYREQGLTAAQIRSRVGL